MIRQLNSRKRPGDIDLGLGEPLLKPDAALLAEAAAWAADSGCRYGPNAGLAEVREAIAGHCAYPGLDAADNVCVTAGSQEAIFLAIKTLCDPGRDEILVVEPAYPLYRKIAQMEGVASRGAGMSASSGFAFDAAAILEAVRPETRLLVLCSPCNPTGRMIGAAALQQLAAGLLALPDPPYVLLDEAYRELHYQAGPPPALAALYPKTLIAGSLSKSNALTGLRLGWLLAPRDVIGPAIKVHQFVLTSANALGQHIALCLIKRGQVGAHRAHYFGRKEAFCRALAAHGIPHIEPEGAFYTMVGLPGAWSARSVEAAMRLVDEYGVVTIPGAAFGDSAQGWLRASFVAEPQDLAEGAARLAAFFAGRAGIRTAETLTGHKL